MRPASFVTSIEVSRLPASFTTWSCNSDGRKLASVSWLAERSSDFRPVNEVRPVGSVMPRAGHASVVSACAACPRFKRPITSASLPV